MKPKLFSVLVAIIASVFAVALSYVNGAHGETLLIIALVTTTVSCATALTATSLGSRRQKKNA
jgi:hypothetical protein